MKLLNYYLGVTNIPEICSDSDIHLLTHIHKNRISSLDNLFIYLTDTVSYISISLIAFLIINAYLTKDKIKRVKGFIILVSYTCAAFISTIIKYTVDRQRPFITYHFIEKLSTGGSPSFPSGHTTEAFAVATAITLCYPKWYIIVPLYTWALAVAYSRMSLGVHYPTDVLAGILIGVITTTICFHFINKLKKTTIHAGNSK